MCMVCDLQSIVNVSLWMNFRHTITNNKPQTKLLTNLCTTAYSRVIFFALEEITFCQSSLKSEEFQKNKQAHKTSVPFTDLSGIDERSWLNLRLK